MSEQLQRSERLTLDEIDDLEKGLEGLKTWMDTLGFGVIAETPRTITFSPRMRSALARSGNLIMDMSIMETRFIQQCGATTVKAKDHVQEEFCLLVTLNNERETMVQLYGVMNGQEVFNNFKGFVHDVVTNRLAMPQPIKEELSRTFLEGLQVLKKDPVKLLQFGVTP